MSNSDVVTPADIEGARVYVRQVRREKLLGASKRGLMLGLLGGVGSYLISPLIHGTQLVTVPIAAVLFGVGASVGVLEVIHWLRHFFRMSRTINAVEKRVGAGERVLASEVKW